MLYVTIDNAFQLRAMFKKFDRDNYSWETYKGLFDYFEEIPENFKLDVIGLCCDLCEESEENIRKAYDLADDENVEDFLWDNTALFSSFIGDDGKKYYGYRVF